MLRLVLLIVFNLLLRVASAQQDDFHFINFSTKNGLSSNTVNVIVKDPYGYMWFATEDGLNKFDGVNFTVYKHSTTDSASIGAGAMMTMQKDQSGNLWVAAGDRLSLYDRKKDAFINYSFSQAVIRAICIDHSGKIWVGTYEGLFLFDHGTGSVKRFTTGQRQT